MFTAPEEGRIIDGSYASTTADGCNGAFLLHGHNGRRLLCIASDSNGWEHVSVSAREGSKVRIPTWGEMCSVKEAFWGAEDVVMQLHPRQSEYVNFHTSVLHLWRPNAGQKIPEPDHMLVGPKTLEEAAAYVINHRDMLSQAEINLIMSIAGKDHG